MEKTIFKNKKSGLSVGIVIIMMVVIGMIVDSVFHLTLQTNRTEQDHLMWLEAKNAAEAAVEYGFAELQSRFATNSSFPTNALAPAQNPLYLPTQYFTTFGNTTGVWKNIKVTLPVQATYDKTSVAQWGTRPTDVIGSVVPPGVWTFINGNEPGNEFDPLKNSLVFVRDVNVYGKGTVNDFRNAHSTTVYAMETLQVRDAPLFANAIFYNMDMEIAPGAAMTVSGPVHGNYNAYISSYTGFTLSFTGQVSTSGEIYHAVEGSIGKTLTFGDVTFANTAGTQISMNQPAGWLDSTNPTFRQQASQLWGGNVESAEFGIPQMNPVALPSYVPGTPSTTDLNYAYQLIDPTLTTGSMGYSAPIETQKFAYKAGLTVVVNTAGASPTYTLQTLQRDASGNVLYDASGNPKTTSLTYTGGLGFVNTQKYTTSGSGATISVTGGLYDARRAMGVGLVQLDVGKLNTALNNGSGNQATDWSNVAANTPSHWWNGIVYVQFATGAPRGTDHVAVASDGWGLQIINAATIPNPSYAQANGIYGTTIATDNPVYVLGDFNADGKSATGAGGNVDSATEPPAAIAGDAITVLSNAWTNSMSARAIGSRVAAASGAGVDLPTEISAAFLTGIVPSNKNSDSTYSGGVENFPRFLEDWSGKTFRYRGSMVSLFESEVARQPWPNTGTVYNAPARDWSFDKLFGQGTYPPGTPNSRTYRRINYRELTAAQWATQIAAARAQMGF